MQLTKLNAATAAHTSACHQRSPNASSNSARVNSQNTTILPVDNAISGACQIETGDVDADRIAHGMRRRAQRKGRRQPSGQHSAEIAKQRRGQHQQQRHGGAAQGEIEGGKQHQVNPLRRWCASRESNPDWRSIQFWAAHAARDVTQMSAACRTNQSRDPSSPRAGGPRLATAHSRDSMQWMISSISKVANAQSIEARAASTA